MEELAKRTFTPFPPTFVVCVNVSLVLVCYLPCQHDLRYMYMDVIKLIDYVNNIILKKIHTNVCTSKYEYILHGHQLSLPECGSPLMKV